MAKRDQLVTLTLSKIRSITAKRVHKYIACELCGRGLSNGETVFQKAKGQRHSVYYDLSHALALNFIDIEVVV